MAPVSGDSTWKNEDKNYDMKAERPLGIPLTTARESLILASAVSCWSGANDEFAMATQSPCCLVASEVAWRVWALAVVAVTVVELTQPPWCGIVAEMAVLVEPTQLLWC